MIAEIVAIGTELLMGQIADSDAQMLSRELIEKRIRSQMNDEEKRKYADFVIVNDGETPLIPQVLELIGSLSEKMYYL